MRDVIDKYCEPSQEVHKAGTANAILFPMTYKDIAQTPETVGEQQLEQP